MRRAWVDIDLGALLRNATTLAGQAGVSLLPMVKADAYGLGAVHVARTLERVNPWGFGVATVPEGEELRAASIRRPILVFSPLLHDDFDGAVRANLTPTLGDAASIMRWKETARPWHLDVDTGMSRAGVRWTDVASLREALIACPPEGVFTHFHSAERSDGSRALQEKRFAEALAALPAPAKMTHAENSGAVEHRGPSTWTVCRPGIFLYGISSGNSPEILPEPVVSMRARVIDIRFVESGETVSYSGTYKARSRRRIATLGAGYADGYRRILGNRASVLLHGRRAPITGVVTMDMLMIDVTDVQCEIGDIATLIGSDGDDRIDVSELASVGELSPYEILTGLRGRLPRRYTEEAP
jgi:alanine racemase